MNKVKFYAMMMWIVFIVVFSAMIVFGVVETSFPRVLSLFNMAAGLYMAYNYVFLILRKENA